MTSDGNSWVWTCRADCIVFVTAWNDSTCVITHKNISYDRPSSQVFYLSNSLFYLIIILFAHMYIICTFLYYQWKSIYFFALPVMFTTKKTVNLVFLFIHMLFYSPDHSAFIMFYTLLVSVFDVLVPSFIEVSRFGRTVKSNCSPSCYKHKGPHKKLHLQ